MSERASRLEPRFRLPATAGVTLIELLLVIALLGIIAAIAMPQVLRLIGQAKLRRAIVDMHLIEVEIGEYERLQEHLPRSLDDLPPRARLDPWGRPYEYFLFQGPGWRGRARKDRFLVPINTFYDLYSVGPDGESRPPLQARPSHDDLVRANDGQYYRLGKEF